MFRGMTHGALSLKQAQSDGLNLVTPYTFG